MPREIVLKQDYDRIESLKLEIEQAMTAKLLLHDKKIKTLEARIKALERSTNDTDNNGGHDGVWWP